jgi:formylmethanofuran dehydrogenase subunit C
MEISAAEGLEATFIQINGGDIRISSSDDGVNAARKSSIYTPAVEINGGTLTIVMGSGDTDAVDSNGNLTINGGTINITGQSSFDCDGTAQYNGGTIIINGQTVNAIPSQMMGGGKGGKNRGGRGL